MHTWFQLLAAKGCICFFLFSWAIAFTSLHPIPANGATSLTEKGVTFEKVGSHHVTLSRGDTSITIVDNEAVNLTNLPNHRAGYNGVASLSHVNQPANVFVPSFSGLNFEHIHDGTAAGLKEKFEPRRYPMELRRINKYTIEIYQAPTGNWKLESCGRYSLLEDGTIEYSFECVPHANDYAKGYIGLFWASYIQNPIDTSIHFKGRSKQGNQLPKWIKATSPRHGVASTHSAAGNTVSLDVDPDFPLTLVGNASDYEYLDPWYYGVTNGMALAFMFRADDNIWFAQSPTGGGNGNPAWDFQWFVHDVVIGKAYGFTMRLACLPFRGKKALVESTKPHRTALQNSQLKIPALQDR